MKDYSRNKLISSEVVKLIEKCIAVTRFPNEPHSLIEKILCDADTFHLGTDMFTELNENVKKEYSLVNGEIPKRYTRTGRVKN